MAARLSDSPGTTFPWFAQYDPDVPRTLDYPEATLAEAFLQSVERHGERPALSFLGDDAQLQRAGGTWYIGSPCISKHAASNPAIVYFC